MVVMMSVHIFSGLGLLCPTETLGMFRALGIARVALGITLSDHNRGEVSGNGWDTAWSQGGTSKCCCKKHKKCPAIPRGNYLKPGSSIPRGSVPGQIIELRFARSSSDGSPVRCER